MQGKAAILSAILFAAAHFSFAQESSDNTRRFTGVISPFLDHHTSISEGYALHWSVAYAPYDKKTNFAYGNLSLSIAGLLKASFSHDGVIGAPTGLMEPIDLLALQLQIVQQREQLPGVSVFLKTMTDKETRTLYGNDLFTELREIYFRGVSTISYDARTTVAGVSLSTMPLDELSINASLGVREIVWKQKWAHYRTGNDLPTGWVSPLAERTNLGIDWSVSAAARPLQQLGVIAEISSMPYADIDGTSLLIEARMGYAGTIGICYYLPLSLRVDLYDRWVLASSKQSAYHQVRLGISSDIQFL
ncbi:MAG: hypothetical protein HY961_13550 [Ignavibacteriae bacterium]|nr:hypothetical protein [Ignavibacteriota bacterium]